MSLTTAISAVINRCDDLGLREVARQLMCATGIHRQRDLVGQAQHAARVTQTVCTHFNAKPILDLADELERAASQALVLVEAEIATLHAATAPSRLPGDFTYEQWLANGVRPPPVVKP